MLSDNAHPRVWPSLTAQGLRSTSVLCGLVNCGLNEAQHVALSMMHSAIKIHNCWQQVLFTTRAWVWCSVLVHKGCNFWLMCFLDSSSVSCLNEMHAQFSRFRPNCDMCAKMCHHLLEVRLLYNCQFGVLQAHKLAMAHEVPHFTRSWENASRGLILQPESHLSVYANPPAAHCWSRIAKLNTAIDVL